jgi:hypothetical protein
MPELEQTSSTDSDRNPRDRGVGISTAASFIFDAEGRYHLEYATPAPHKSPVERVRHWCGRFESSPLMDALDLIGGPKVLLLLAGWSVMLIGGAIPYLPLSLVTIIIGMLIVEATLLIWARSK